jgi:Tfp pilus assembly pilus retraction ATPase PilT
MAAIYLVKTPTGENLVKADNKQQAINHIIRKDVTASTLTAEQTADYIVDRQMKVIDATAAPATEAKETAE